MKTIDEQAIEQLEETLRRIGWLLSGRLMTEISAVVGIAKRAIAAKPEWPKWYDAINPAFVVAQRHEDGRMVSFKSDGTESPPYQWQSEDDDSRKQITEEEALSRIQRPQLSVRCRRKDLPPIPEQAEQAVKRVTVRMFHSIGFSGKAFIGDVYVADGPIVSGDREIHSDGNGGWFVSDGNGGWFVEVPE